MAAISSACRGAGCFHSRQRPSAPASSAVTLPTADTLLLSGAACAITSASPRAIVATSTSMLKLRARSCNTDWRCQISGTLLSTAVPSVRQPRPGS